MTAWPTPPVPTPEQRALGCRLYNTLGLCATSYCDWFAEGVPHEWVKALDAIQAVLTQCKRQAAQAEQRDTHGAGAELPLFATMEGRG